MGSGISSASLARGSGNVAVVGGDGSAVVSVSGCSAAGLAEPVIVLTANHDPTDQMIGSNSSYPHPAAAFVTGWSPNQSVLEFNVSTYDATNGLTANSDFSFTVNC
jgi:hypothetical protein